MASLHFEHFVPVQAARLLESCTGKGGLWKKMLSAGVCNKISGM